jgi:predicted PurR-regulated permease PerM
LLGRLRHRERADPTGDRLTQEQFDRRFSAQFHKAWVQHLAQLRAERRHGDVPTGELTVISAGQSNFRRAEVPYGVDLAAAWSWRFLVIVAAGVVLVKAVGMLALVVLPVIVALFLAALLQPVVALLARGVSRGAATGLVVLGLVAFVALMITFATQQIVQGANDLSGQVVDALDQIRTWLQDGPVNASDAQIEDAIKQAQDAVTSSNAEIVKRLTEVSTTVSHVVAGFFIVLFSLYFFLADGRAIWAWVVRLFPRTARARADSSGQVAWLSLTAFVRATVLVAFTDALGVVIVAAVLGLPFVAAIGVLIFIGAFIPLVGATISGAVAVLVALVAQGPITALLMLAGVIAVQQLEAHVLQPFLLGRMVRVHPLAVILAVASGVFLAGIPGSLVAVPLAASVNAVAVYLASAPPEPEREGVGGRERVAAGPDEPVDERAEDPLADREPPDEEDVGPLGDKPERGGAAERFNGSGT